MDLTSAGAGAGAGLMAGGFTAGAMIFNLIISLAVSALMYWKVFTKAGEAGWKSLVPLYNLFILFRISGYSGWMFLLLLVSIANIVIMFMQAIKLAEKFGKGAGFGVLMVFFPIIMYPILGFGSASYKK